MLDFDADVEISPSLERIYEFGLRHRLTSTAITQILSDECGELDKQAIRLTVPRLSSFTWRRVRDRILAWHEHVDYVGRDSYVADASAQMLSTLWLMFLSDGGVEQTLRSRSIVGEPRQGCWCPIANLMRSVFNAVQVYVGLQVAIVGGVPIYLTPEMKAFVSNFDEFPDLYPDLRCDTSSRQVPFSA